jgi:UDP-glucose 4-epimerase
MGGLSCAIVVGGAGFLGSWLVDVLLVEGVAVTVLDPRPGNENGRAERIGSPVEDVDLGVLVDERQTDTIFQLAGTGLVPLSVSLPLDDLGRNAATTLAVLEGVRASSRRPRVVFVSSAAVYGEGRRMPMDESHPLEPVSPYGVSKLAAEHYVRVYARMHGIEGLSVRPFSLYGPRQRKLVVHDLLTRLLDGENPLVVAGRADVTRDFVFVEDAARALAVLARNAPARGEAYNLASGEPVSLGTLVKELAAAAGRSPEVRFTDKLRPGDPLRWDGDPSAAAALGVELRTTLRDGLRRTAAWLAGERAEVPAGA